MGGVDWTPFKSVASKGEGFLLRFYSVSIIPSLSL